MADYDFFDLTGLPFDPPEKATEKVTAAIEAAKEKVKKEQHLAQGDLLKQKEIKEKLDFLDCIKGAYEKLAELAEKKVKQEIEKLKKLISLQGQSGSTKFTDGTINSHHNRTGLSKKHVEEVFSKTPGFKKISKEELYKLRYPKFPERADPTHEKLGDLRKNEDPDPKRTGRKQVENLYDFAAYMSNKMENKAEYRGKLTSELAELFNELYKEVYQNSGNLGELYKSLLSAGKSYVFDSDDHRQAYDAYLKYKHPDLTELFSSLRSYSSNKQDLLEPLVAEKFIRKISAIFGCDYEVAVAIYNKEAGLQAEPYIPVNLSFPVECPNCHYRAEFASDIEAQKINECPKCHHALYMQKQCNNNTCRKSMFVQISCDKCPECGYAYPNAALFAKHFAAAEQALRKSDFESARNFLFQAQSADPGEKARTDELAARISAEEKKYEKPVNDLRKLLADKMFQKASDALADIIGKFPGLNVSAFEAQINAALSQARTKFAGAGRLSPSGRADECLAILRDCVDFEPAISFLQSTPPETCKSFAVGIDSSAWCANISWSRSSEQGISYRLVRKQGKETPANEKDGQVLVDDTKETSYQDKTLLPGQSYGYAVFAIRRGVFSAATGKTAVLLADVSNPRAEQINTTVRLTWDVPKNCTGVTIRRTQNGTETTLSSNAHGSFEDKNVQYGTAYHYKLCANYAGQPASQGAAIVITPMLKIDSFTISTEQIKGNTYKISWSINRGGIDLRVLVGEKQVRELRSDSGSCNLELPVDGFHTITVLAYSGGSWLPSENSLQVNTYTPCSIDKTASRFYENTIAGLRESAYNIELHLKVGGTIPPNVAGFYYAVRTGASQNRWPAAAEIGNAADIHKISLAAYQKSGEILYTETAHEEISYYVSLFTIYNLGGKEIVSEPKPCRFDRPITANLFWKVSKNLFSGLKLSIEVSGNRPLAQVPRFVLCACADNQHLLSHNDPKAVQLLTIPEAGLETPQKTYSVSYEVKTDLSARQLKGSKFFLFEAEPVPGQEFTFHWSKGFTGKI